MYTIELSGKPIAVVNTRSQAEAEELFAGDWFKEEMMVFETEDGSDLWNGSDPFVIRSALPEEVAKFEPAHVKALQGGAATDDDPYLVFLIPVTDATDELD